MTIERRDGLISTIAKTRKPLAAFRGQRTWSPLTKKVTIAREANLLMIPTSVEEVKPINTSSIRYQKLLYIYGVSYPETDFTSSKEEINLTRKPWHGKIRYRPNS